MTKLGLRPYRSGDQPARRSVPVAVIILTWNEEVNIRRCIQSVGWASQVVVIDSGSTDQTISIARSLGAETIENPWLGYSGQREFALRLPQLLHDWVYFVDADEWVSPELAAEIDEQLRSPASAGFAHRFRIVFQGRWIRHCGWYSGSWIVRVMDRRHARFDYNAVGERAHIDGRVCRLTNDIVDNDLKGLAPWLRKHVHYAELEAERRARPHSLRQQLSILQDPGYSGRKSRTVLKEIIFPRLPARPVALFAYMYILRLGFLDGIPGLRFCFYHAWYQAVVSSLQAEEGVAQTTWSDGKDSDRALA